MDPPACTESFCVLLELEGPFKVGQPFTAVVTIEPSEDISDLEINAFSPSPAVVFEPGQWIMDVKAGEPVVLESTVTISREGYLRLYANASYYSMGVADFVGLLLTQDGGVINPTSDGPHNKGASQTESTP